MGETIMAVKEIKINGKTVSAREGETVLEAAEDAGIAIPRLCHLDGVSDVGACRMCLVEIEGTNRLVPSCVTKIEEGMSIQTETPKLQEYRRMIVELLFAEGNHTCAVCVVNNNCQLQDTAIEVGMDHSRFPYNFPVREVDLSHPEFGKDDNRCILCTRCVRACDEIEGAHVWDVAGRGYKASIISGLKQPWGTVDACTSCGKCVQSCPTGALFYKGSAVSEMDKDRTTLEFLVKARREKQWTR
jgi:bidirectional [NiFe] hydrogenase diaphorase subunit